jgi:hypothetical protein
MSATNGEALVSAINRLLVRLNARGVSANEIVACIKPLIADIEAEVEELKAAGGPPFIRSKAIQNLREEVARLNNLLLQADELNEGALFKISETIARAARAEAELAAERARLDYVQEWGFDFLTRAAIDAAMKEDAK